MLTCYRCLARWLCFFLPSRETLMKPLKQPPSPPLAVAAVVSPSSTCTCSLACQRDKRKYHPNVLHWRSPAAKVTSGTRLKANPKLWLLFVKWSCCWPAVSLSRCCVCFWWATGRREEVSLFRKLIAQIVIDGCIGRSLFNRPPFPVAILAILLPNLYPLASYTHIALPISFQIS